jgi:hypothetical protein
MDVGETRVWDCDERNAKHRNVIINHNYVIQYILLTVKTPKIAVCIPTTVMSNE